MSEQELTELESRVLRFERQWHTYGGAKDGAIRQEFDMSAPAYFQLLNTLLDSPAAYAADPILIKRLRRIRESRHQHRARTRMAR